MSTSVKALQNFLIEHCEIRHFVLPSGKKERRYVMATKGCLLFMAETYVEEIRSAIAQHQDPIHFNVSWEESSSEPDIDTLQIAVEALEPLDDKQAFIVLRSIEGIKRDIDEGIARSKALETLFRGTASVTPINNLEGERHYLIRGKDSAQDKRGYAEKYAELIATNVLFNLPKVVNTRIQKAVTKEARGRFFLEGYTIATPKIRYGTNPHVELTVSEEGAVIYIEAARKDPKIRENLERIFMQAITDPFGLSFHYYMGKHALIKLTEPKK